MLTFPASATALDVILAAMTEDEPMGGSGGSVYAIDDNGPTEAEDEVMLSK